MTDEKKCPHCGKPVPPTALGGICPECMLKAGLAAQTEGPGGAGQQGTKIIQPALTPEEIAALFPQLEILECLGRGGMGVVYKARQPRLNRIVALKIIAQEKDQDGQFAGRFAREAQALARLNHPNIVTVHDFGEAGGHCYLVMEFVDGLNLRQLLLAGKMAPEQALTIVPMICEALQYAHNEGIVHRDIKPENILLDKQGRVKIADFGIAKMLGLKEGQQALTGARDVVGTPHYMAPEQLERPLTVDHRADIYSLGVVFYEMLTGELPLGKFAPPSRKVQIDVRLDEVVLHTLEKEPARRYQQVNQLKTDVETIAGTVPPAAGLAAKGGLIPLPATPADKATSDKIILPAFLLAFPFGLFGAHRFYVGKIWTAALQLAALIACGFLIIACATLGGTGEPVTGILLGFLIFGCLIWALIDWILIVCKAFTDGQGRRITHWLHPQNGGIKTGVNPLASPLSTPSSIPPTAPPSIPPSTPPPGGAAPSAAGLPPALVVPAKTPAPGTGKIVAPAVGLMVVGMFKLVSALIALFVLAGSSAGWLEKLLADAGVDLPSHWGIMPGIAIVLLKVLPACLICFGGLQMMRLRSYAWAIAAAILGIVCCSLVGFPVGIWALIILAQPDVRETFAHAAVSPSPKMGGKWPWILGAAAAAGVIVIGLVVAHLLAWQTASVNPNLTVHGTVTDAVTGKAIADARVDDNQYGADADKAPQQAWTDKKGHYKLKTWAEEHTIAASAPGYETKMSTLLTKAFGSERDKQMDFKLQPTRATAPAASEGSQPALNLSSQNGHVVIETTNGRLAADQIQLKVDTNGTTTVTARKIESGPAVAARPAAVVPTLQSEPYAHRTKDGFEQDYNQTLPLNADGRISLDNVNGRVEINGWNRDGVSIQAVKHGKSKESVEELEIQVETGSDHVTIHARQTASWFGWKQDSAKVDYILQVPRRAQLANIASVNGPINIEDVSGNIEASTVNGRLQVQGAAGILKLSTVNGQVEAELAALGDGQTVSLSTVNGQVEATLPVDADATVTANTVNGGLSSEFSALVVKKVFPVSSNLKGTLGNGSARVKANTVNGSIHFRKGREISARDPDRRQTRPEPPSQNATGQPGPDPKAPPAAAQELAARAEAASAITATDKRDAALVALAKDAATAGDFALLKKTLSQITIYDTHDTATYEAARALARAGRRADAVAVAKTIISLTKRDAALRELAE